MADFNNGITDSEKTLLLTIYTLHYFNDFASQQVLKNMNFEYTERLTVLQSYGLIVLSDDD